MSALLAADRITVSYGGVAAVTDVSLQVHEGEVVVLLGPNGAGKSTTLLTLAGELSPDSGATNWRGQPTRAPLYRRARAGLSFIADDRSVFPGMSARENYRMGKCELARAVELAPELGPHLSRRTGLLSGGQQQILATTRALARSPIVLMADELSLGLAPLVVDRLLATVRAAADNGLGVLLVEQHVRKALKVADRVYVLRNGRIEFNGTAAEARAHARDIEAAYMSAVPTTPNPPHAGAPVAQQ